MLIRFFLSQEDKIDYNSFSVIDNHLHMIPGRGVIAICRDLTVTTVYTEFKQGEKRVINTYQMEAPPTIYSSRSNIAGRSSILEQNHDPLPTIANEIRAFDNGFFCQVYKFSLPQQELNNFEKTLCWQINRSSVHCDPEKYVDKALEQTNENFRLKGYISNCITR